MICSITAAVVSCGGVSAVYRCFGVRSVEETVPEKEDSTLLPIILGTVAAVGAAAVIGVYYIKKK